MSLIGASRTPVADRIADLLCSAAFDHPARDLRLVETHISWIILAGNYAYKIRKPVNFGFLDFSTLEQRQADCEAEVRLNRRLCPDLYLGIVDVVERGGRLYMGGQGESVEPAVRMHRLPDAGMLPALVERSAADDRLMDRIARDLANFHSQASTATGVHEYGSVTAVAANWQENFVQTAPFSETLLPSPRRSAIERFVSNFLETHDDLLQRRVNDGRFRDGHGDLHAGSVCARHRRVYLFDCIEFSARYRCADVASEVAFLAMDLEHLGRADLSTAFVYAYVRHSADRELLSLLDFYKCYRAFVRGKVLGLRLGQASVQPADAEHCTRQARAYFDLAYAYATRPAQPVLLVSMGLPASGKSTLAHAVACRCAMVHLSSDIVRKQLAGLRPTARRVDGFQRGLYSRSVSRRTYAALKRKTARWLRRRQSVVLDATFGQPAERAALRLLARKTGARLVVAVCRADESVITARLAARATDTHTTSDARLELWPALRAAFVEPLEFPEALNVDTTQPLETCIDLVVSAAWSPASGNPSGGAGRRATSCPTTQSELLVPG